ncbi:pullulanase [Ruficoccus amylovorans]|uniref:Pullulanase n=1 Tax=Ruficoccus amylovorans TaxID=1804625 RepID=A0A842HEY9_9BACT|nr:alpha-amylase family glycosyl hydrolase [Ruficoccus amylovorans]MBC2595175.1 pullulanase [Ruficoccus amylovorans]
MKTRPCYLLLTILALLPGGPAFAQASNFSQLHFRGTPNGWNTQPMTLIYDHLWLTDTTFNGLGDANGDDRFKFDTSYDFSGAYGDTDANGIAEPGGGDIYPPLGPGSYRILFDDETLAYAVTRRNYTEVYVRGTANGFDLSCPMALVNHHTWQAELSFSGDPNDRFVFDHSQDWSGKLGDTALDGTVESNGGDIPIPAAGNYLITLNDQTHAYSLANMSARNFDQVYFRGTLNGWGNAPMSFVGDHTWVIEVNFVGQASDRFKFDRFGDWSEYYGDNQSDGIAESGGADIHVSPDRYFITFNDDTLTYSVTSTDAAEPIKLGHTYSPELTTFAIWSPDTANVKLSIDGDVYTMLKQPDNGDYTDVYAIQVYGDLVLKEYYFLVDDVQVRDPYGRMVVPGTDTNIVIDPFQTTPSGGRIAPPSLVEREDAVIYEVHVRDFTIHSSSGVDADKRGKFLGMVQPGTSYGGVSTGLQHLIDLGVTHVQLLPIFDYGTCSAKDPDYQPDSYNWGYDPENYNIPEERYAVDPYDYHGRIRELKEMIDLLHAHGLRVIMDVVYNHTWVIETEDAYGNKQFSHPEGENMFSDITLDYFNTNAPGTYGLAGTGNSINPRVPMVSRMIRDSLEYWAGEIGVDGFRFDLIGIFDYSEVAGWASYLETRFPDRQLLIYGEPWNGYATDPDEAERVRLGTIGLIADTHVGCFNPKLREAIKGNNDNGSGGGYAFNQLANMWEIQVGSRGGIRYAYTPSTTVNTWDSMFANDPEQCINYVSAHDNLCLWDKIEAWASLNGISNPTYKKRISTFANGIVLTSQGIPFLHGGEEFLRTKQGDSNSYKSPDAINQFDWQRKADNLDIFAYYQDLISTRRAHPGFRMNTWQEITDNITTYSPTSTVLVNHIHGAANNTDSWSEIFVIYNCGLNTTVTLPSGDWHVAIEKADPTEGNGRTVSGSIVAEGTAVTVLYQE